MLYEAATGSLPWKLPTTLKPEGLAQFVYEAKVTGKFDLDKVRPSHRKLIAALLHPEPSRRASAVQALKLIGTEESEIHGGTIHEGNIRRETPSVQKPRLQPGARRAVPVVPDFGTPRQTKSKSAKPTGKEMPGNLKALSRFLCWFPFGFFHPIVSMIWYVRFESKVYLRNAIIGTVLSMAYLSGALWLPRVLDPDTHDMVVDPQYGPLLSLAAIGMWGFSFAAHGARPRK
jgi:hypothetical protein